MKKFITLLVLMIAFTTNAVAQWNQDPTIKEYHWFGQYEYVDITPGFEQRKINWSGNYLESVEIWRGSTGGGDLAHQPKTSFYSWLEHKLRFSVENTSAWKIRGTTNTAYNPKGFPDQDTDEGTNSYGGMKGGGQGLKNISGSDQNFSIHNLKAGDSYDVRYYVDGGNSESHITGSATGTVTVSIPANALIRNVVITLAEYQASDFKVEEVDDVSSITSAYADYAGGTYGTIGYRYSFKHAGVLEDKHGAVPYMTMSFGNDNDMTFVRSLNEVTYTWGSYKSVTPKMFTKNGDDNGAVSESTPDGSGVYVVRSKDNPTDEWDTQFWIGTTEYSLPAGQKFKLKFDYKADDDATVHTQTHGGNAGPYIIWHCIGDLNFSTGWQTFEQEITIENDMAGWMSVAFNLNVLTSATNYYFRNITLEIPERTENISTDALGAASIIHSSNDLNPTDKHLQYPWTYKNNPNYSDPFNEDEIKDRFVGKEWSTFTAEEDPNHGVNPNVGSDWTTGEEYVYGDRFNSIWPLCGNFFYFFPEVDGLLQIEYYCEGSNEAAAFWYKQKEGGDYAGYGDQPKTLWTNTKALDNWNTNGNNNYKLTVPVKKGGVYYLCSLPTNLHAQPIVRLKSYTFIPQFRVYPLYKVVHNTETGNSSNEIKQVAEIFGGPYTNLDGVDRSYGNNAYDLTDNTYTRNAMPEKRIKCLGNVVSAKAKIEYSGGHQYLSFYDIKFRESTNAAGEAYNPGGAIVAHVNTSVGQASFVLTIAYDAADAKWGKKDGKDTRIAATEGGKEVKRWDFYSGKGDYNASGIISDNWDLGKYGSLENYGKDDKTMYRDNQSGWEGKSKLFRETNKADLLTTDWEYDYVDVPNKKEPIFKSIYDMEADNADMIHETAGLVFFTEPNELGIWNENPTADGSFQDRYIGMMGGGKLIIPRLKANDRIVIKMGCFGNTDSGVETQQATLKITGAYDATGTKEIKEENGDYVIGGSGVEDGNDTNGGTDITDKSQPWGEYHFVAKGGDFTLEVDKEKNEADLLKFYSIVIYRNAKDNNADILTENELLGDEGHRQILNTQDFTTDADNVELHTHYRGLNEKTNYAKKTPKTGNLTESDLVMTSMSSNTLWHTIFANLGDTPFTPDKAKFGVFKARIGVQTIGEDYVTDYADCMIPVGYRETKTYPYTWDFTDLKKYVSASIDTDGNETQVTEDDLKIWNEFGLRVAPEEWDGNIYASGGQLYGGKTMIDETRGIGITYENNDQVTSMTGDGTDLSGGLAVGNGTYGFIVPQLAKEQAVYVRAHKVDNTTQKHNYEESDGSTTYIYGQAANSNRVHSFTYHETVDDGTGDEVFALVMPSSLTKKHDVRLNFQGYEVKKIAVSTDPKSVNKKGYASESRARVIDPNLTGYMTGGSVKSYMVTDADYSKRELTLTELTKPIPYVAADAETNTEEKAIGYIIENKTKNEDKSTSEEDNFELDVLNGGFHLFVPDMHDTETMNCAASMMTPQLTETKLYSYDGAYVNYVLSYKYYQLNGDDPVGQQQEGEEMFYRVSSKGIKLRDNSAYLKLLKEDVHPSGSTGSTPAKFTFRFVNWDDPVPTAIEEANVMEMLDGANSVWYNLNGQKLNGMPASKGLYIVNGKKVLVK